MAQTHYTLYPRNRWSSGALTVVVVFAFGLVLLWGLFRAPRAHAPASPDVPWGVPSRPLRVVCLDLGLWTSNFMDAAEFVEPLRADFVLAQRVPGDAVLPLAERLRMQRTFYPQNYARIGPDDGAAGCLVLSPHPLYEAGPLHGGAARTPPLGVWAIGLLDGRRFALVSADAGPRLEGPGVPALATAAALDRRWSSLGAPPVLAAFRVPEMLSTREQLLKEAGLTDAAGPLPDNIDRRALTNLIAVAGPWRVAPAEAAHWVAPGIMWVEVGGE